ncbi:pyrrolo-quinoline quinone [Mycolicibacterium sp. CH28]|uniref:outer membrane protein assembly factor BamB family protein n=1 Tax=Mycolicibacterium sp. CH28 TaxID=2512237 RepID=UPI0010819FE9|nr:PQQ-binding-like beta-propeller repeat protein [Mycolicibacterium sp. CH28]TGD84847.1 pyrrolo-quinoline quinone [Mycolicibacterium sp. CH28]
MLRRLLASASTLLVVSGLTGCGNTDTWVESSAAPGWSAQYSDAANSSYTATGGASALKLRWSRSVKGELGAGAALGAGNYLAVNGQTAGGCSLMVWENDNNGRQRWCTRMVLGGGFTSPLFDQFDNLFIGQPGLMLSYPPTQWIRWRQNVIGMPTTARFLGAGQLLVITHLGQVLVFDSHRGTVMGTPLDLVEGLDPTDSTRGLTDCAQSLPHCPVAAPPAFAASTSMIVVSLWQPGARASALVGLGYHPGQTPLITREWTSDAVGAGVLAAPVLSADGKTVYVNGRDGKLWALNTSDGKAKWSVPLGFQPQTPPSVTPGGLIVSGGGPDTRLVALKDGGDHAEVVWHRDDVTPLATSSQAGADVAYTVVADPPSGLSLLVFDPADGHTVNSYPIPQADGFPVGVSVSHDRRVVVATSAGQVYSFDPAT